MFFDLYLLRSQGKFGIIWIAGTRGVKALRSADIQNLDVAKACNDILQMVMSESLIPKQRLSLALSTRLLHGVIRIYGRKVTVLYEDVCKAMTTVKKPLWFLQPQEPHLIETPRRKRTKKPRRAVSLEEVAPQLVPQEAAVIPRVGEITDADVSRILEARDDIVVEPANITMVEIPDQQTRLAEEYLDFGMEGNMQFIENIMGPMPEHRRLTTEAIIATRQAMPPPALLDITKEIHKPVIERMDLDRIDVVAPTSQEAPVPAPPAAQETPAPAAPVEKETAVPEVPPERRQRFVLPKLQTKDGDIVKTRRKELKFRGHEDDDLIREADPNIDFRMFELTFKADHIPNVEEEEPFIHQFISAMSKVHFDIAKESLESVPRSSVSARLSLQETPIAIPLITVSEIPQTAANIAVSGYNPIEPLATSSLLEPVRTPVPLERGEVVPEQQLTPSIRERPSEISVVPQRIQMDLEEVIPQAPPVQETIQERMQMDEQIVPQVQETIRERSLTEEEIKINKQQELKKMIHEIKRINKQGKSPITIEDVARKPLTRKTIAVAFSHLLELHKKQYVELKSKESSSELSHIVLGKKLQT